MNYDNDLHNLKDRGFPIIGSAVEHTRGDLPNRYYPCIADTYNPSLKRDCAKQELVPTDTCSREHGVGLHKMAFLMAETSSGAVDMMRSIKRALDPLNIMNPGKIFSL